MPTDGRTHSLSNEPLWAAIMRAPLPSKEHPRGWFTDTKTESFQERLASKYGLTPRSALRLEWEYRRFLYLKAIDGGILTPSKRVDQAWHLHIETPRGEWDRFCHDVLERQLDHQTGLSQAEARASYARLLDLYRREYNDEPPTDIWPTEREKRRRAIGIAVANAGIVVIVVSIFFGQFVPVSGGWMIAFFAVGMAIWIFGNHLSDGTDLEEVASANCG